MTSATHLVPPDYNTDHDLGIWKLNFLNGMPADYLFFLFYVFIMIFYDMTQPLVHQYLFMT